MKSIRFHCGKKDIVYAWAPTALETMIQCPRKWLLDKSRKIINVAFALGSFLHKKKEQLALNPKFKSAEKWANHCRAVWYQFHAKEEQPNIINGQIIQWARKDDKHIAAAKIKKICLAHFDRFMSEPRPLIHEFVTKRGKRYRSVEYPFRIVIDDGIRARGFSGKIDEIRPGMEIRDYKSGWRSYVVRGVPFSFQPTHYNLGFCSLCYLDPEFRARVGVSDELSRTWGGNPHLISEDVRFHFFTFQNTRKEKVTEIINGKAREAEREIIEDPIVPAQRSDFNYYSLCQVIDYAEYLRLLMREHKSYPAWEGMHCNYCLHRDKCTQMTRDLPKTPVQLYLLTQRQEARLTTSSAKQLEFDFSKKEV